MSGNTILVTGGTSGIGRALAEALHARGNEVIVAGRRRALLDEIAAAHPGMHGLELDVREPESLKAALESLERDFPALNVLISNAGIARPEDWASGAVDAGTARGVVDTNILGVVELAAGLVPILRGRPGATMITTTSGLAFVPRAAVPTYCASKAFLHAWLQALRFQLRGQVEVLELVPPYVQTQLAGPGQAADPLAMPLAEFTDEVMGLLETGDTPDGEILVDRVKALRFAERDGRFAAIFDGMNERGEHVVTRPAP